MSSRQFKVEEKEGGRLFHLRRDVKLLVKWSSEKQVQVELWRHAAVLPPDVGNLYTSAFRDRLLKAAGPVLFPEEELPRKDREAALLALAEDIGDVAILLNAPTPSGKTLHAQMAQDRSGPSVSERLVRYARQGAKFFHTPDRVAYAALKVGAHVEHYRVGSRDFLLWVQNEYWIGEKQRIEEEQQASGGALYVASPEGQGPLPEVVRDRDLSDAVRLLEGFALFDGPEHEVYRRIASDTDTGSLYIDLCDAAWRVVEVTREGWRILPGHEVPVKFARTAGMLPLPDPEEGGSLEPLRTLLHLGRGPQEERNWRLITAWLVQALTLDGAYGILNLVGNQGSSKSYTQHVLRNLVDPNVAPLRYKPREERDLYIAASNGWTISLDNMSKVPEWLSNALCNIASHGAFGIRKNYTDDAEVLFKARRPILINGIGDILTYPDLLDRAVIVRLPPFESDADKERKTDDEVLAQAERIAPGVFGALLDCLVYYLGAKDSIPNPHVRMVSFAKVGIAVEQALGAAEGSFMHAYLQSRGDANATALEAFPVGAVVLAYAEDYSQEDPWQGTTSELLSDLASRAGETLRQAPDWPRSPSDLGTQLNRLATDLRRAGVEVERFARKGTRMLRLFSGV
jgi:hypothetical protein